jgi:hypothetical protein
MKDLIELKQTFTKENPFVTLKPNIFNLYIESMFDKIFSQLILFDYIYKYDNYDSSKISCIGTLGSKNAAILLENYCENHENISESRLHEIKSMVQVLSSIGYKGNIIVTCDRIKILDMDRKMVTDLDGLAVGFSKNKFSVLLIEAKNQRKRGQSASIKQLKRNIDKLNLNTTIESSISCVENYCAYSFTQIDGNKYSKIHR